MIGGTRKLANLLWMGVKKKKVEEKEEKVDSGY